MTIKLDPEETKRKIQELLGKNPGVLAPREGVRQPDSLPKVSSFAKGLVRSLVRAGVYGGATYGAGTAIYNPRRKKDREDLATRSALVAGSVGVVGPVASVLERGVSKVLKIGDIAEPLIRRIEEEGGFSKDATVRHGPRYALKALMKAVKRHEREGQVIRQLKEVLKKKSDLPPALKSPAAKVVGGALAAGAAYKYVTRDKKEKQAVSLDEVYATAFGPLAKESTLIKEAPRTREGKEPNIPQKVKDIADAVRRDDPGASDAKAYRIAWATRHGTRKDMKPSTQEKIQKKIPKAEKERMRKAAEALRAAYSLPSSIDGR